MARVYVPQVRWETPLQMRASDARNRDDRFFRNSLGGEGSKSQGARGFRKGDGVCEMKTGHGGI